jgi:hypothetical protein
LGRQLGLALEVIRAVDFVRLVSLHEGLVRLVHEWPEKGLSFIATAGHRRKTIPAAKQLKCGFIGEGFRAVFEA